MTIGDAILFVSFRWKDFCVELLTQILFSVETKSTFHREAVVLKRGLGQNLWKAFYPSRWKEGNLLQILQRVTVTMWSGWLPWTSELVHYGLWQIILWCEEYIRLWLCSEGRFYQSMTKKSVFFSMKLTSLSLGPVNWAELRENMSEQLAVHEKGDLVHHESLGTPWCTIQCERQLGTRWEGAQVHVRGD